MSKIRLLLADDHTLVRQSIGRMLGAEADLELVGEAANGAEAVARCIETRPDIVLMDIGMPGLGGFDAARQIRRSRPDTKILFLTMYDDQEYLAECIQVGGSGYVLKDCTCDQLIAAVRDVQRGGSYLSPRMLSYLVDDFRTQVRADQHRTRLAALTQREKEVLKQLAEGNSVKEIASVLNLSVKTVEAHKFNLMRKLDLHNKAQLVQYAIQKKVIQLTTVA